MSNKSTLWVLIAEHYLQLNIVLIRKTNSIFKPLAMFIKLYSFCKTRKSSNFKIIYKWVLIFLLKKIVNQCLHSSQIIIKQYIITLSQEVNSESVLEITPIQRCIGNSLNTFPNVSNHWRSIIEFFLPTK